MAQQSNGQLQIGAVGTTGNYQYVIFDPYNSPSISFNTSGPIGTIAFSGDFVSAIRLVPPATISMLPSATRQGWGIQPGSSAADLTFNQIAPTAPITATSITSNVLTVTIANELEAGEQPVLVGTQEAFLNGQQVTVLASGLSSTQFEANFTHADYTNSSDTGTLSLGGAIGFSNQNGSAGILIEGSASVTKLFMGTTGGNAITFQAFPGGSGRTYADLLTNSIAVQGTGTAGVLFGDPNSPDGGISRLGAASLAIGNGTAGDFHRKSKVNGNQPARVDG